MRFFRAPWMYVVLAFAVLLIAWGTLIFVATKYRSETIPIESENS